MRQVPGSRRGHRLHRARVHGCSQTCDIVFDAVGKRSPTRSKRVLAENGFFVSIRSSAEENTENLLVLRDLVCPGQQHRIGARDVEWRWRKAADLSEQL
jgi:NADPH:quinone reductase-like Zn-dependent oxidoreductase